MVKMIVGANWDDEGKGKITDVMAAQSDIVIRYQGGSNAGYTIINEHGKFALHQLPSGVFYDHTTNIIGNSVVLSVENLIKEMDSLWQRGVPEPKLTISGRVQIVMLYHVEMDAAEEARLSSKSFGSTKSGIAPFYSDKYAKIGFQVSKLYDDEVQLKEKIQQALDVKNSLYQHLYHKEPLTVDVVYEELMGYRQMIELHVVDTFTFLHQAVKEGKTILLEGQLGALKDPDPGIYPMVISSPTLAGYGAVGVGVPPYEIKEITAVVRAYPSAVGAGEFVSEIFGEEADELRRRGDDGGEYGAITSCPRRMGWLDLVASRYGRAVQSVTSVALTVINVLGYPKEIPACMAYELDSKQIDYFSPASWLHRCKPVLKTMPGWCCDLRGITRYEDLPGNVRRYIEFVEEQIDVPVETVSNEFSRSDITYR